MSPTTAKRAVLLCFGDIKINRKIRFFFKRVWQSINGKIIAFHRKVRWPQLPKSAATTSGIWCWVGSVFELETLCISAPVTLCLSEVMLEFPQVIIIDSSLRINAMRLAQFWIRISGRVASVRVRSTLPVALHHDVWSP